MQPGAVVGGRFELELRAAAGGMGVVYRARDRATGDRVALKVLGRQEQPDGGRFAREARLLAELSHPGIVRYVAHGVTDAASPWLAMEWLDGEDLRARLARDGLTPADAVALAGRIAEALAAAHARGVVHRDVKPANLFLVGGALDRVKVLDFGVAHLTAATVALTRTGALVGTPAYMAPEQARGTREVDARADVFALGAVLYECLTGRPAFGAAGQWAVLGKVLFEEPPPLARWDVAVPPELEALLARLLSKDPAARPRDAGDVAAELSRLGPLDDVRRAPAGSRTPAEALTGGEQRLVSVVLLGLAQRFAAVSETVAEGAAPAAPASPLHALRAAAARHGGRLEPLAGGPTVVVLDGARRGAATDQAVQAAHCALALRDLVPGAPIALATGRGVAGGAALVGEVIDRAAPLLAARARGVRVHAGTAGLLETRFELAAVPGTTAMELLREREPDAPRRLLGRPTPCVGRDRELGALEGIFAECAAEGLARPVLVTGPPGAGKSRVRVELLRRLAARPDAPEVWMAHGDPMSAGSPFGLLGEALRRACGILDGEPVAARRGKLAARVARRVPPVEQRRVAEFLGELIGAPFPAEDSLELRAARQDAALMGDQLRGAWDAWLTAECAARPVVLVLEDLHWGDLPTVKLVDDALRSAKERPFMVLALARPEVAQLFPRLWADRALLHLGLGELSRRAGERLVRDVLGEAADPAAVARIVEQAQGNAFYLEELIRAAAEGREGPPGSVVAMVQARLQGMELEARRVLRAASVFGQAFWTAGVAALLGETATELGGWLDALAEREVVVRAAVADEWRFRHALVRDAAYAMLTDDDRRLGHRLAAGWLEAAGVGEALALAEHAERGGDRPRAAGHYRRAAEQALEGNDYAAAIERAERGLACGAAGDAAEAAWIVQVEAFRWTGPLAESERRAREAMAQVARGGPNWFAAAQELARALHRLARREPLVALGEEVAALAESAPGAPDRARVRAMVQVADHVLRVGAHDLAERIFAWVETAGAAVAAADPLVAAAAHEAQAMRARFAGDLAAVLRHAEAGRASYALAGDRRRAQMVTISLGDAHIHAGRHEGAVEILRGALAEVEALGLHPQAALARLNLGLALAHRGALAEAERLEREALASATRQENHDLAGFAGIYLATVLSLAGEHAEAEERARAAARVLAFSPPEHAYALATLARVLLAAGRGADALEPAQAAAALARQGMQEGEALVRLVRAEALRAAGDEAASRAAIADARERLTARAARIRDDDLARSFLESVPENARTLALAAEWLGAE